MMQRQKLGVDKELGSGDYVHSLEIREVKRVCV